MKFFRSVADEMKQVTWPTKKQLRKDTLVVIEIYFICSIVLYHGYCYPNGIWLDFKIINSSISRRGVL